MRNIQRAVSCGEQITGQSQSEDGDSLGQQILIVVGERGSSGTISQVPLASRWDHLTSSHRVSCSDVNNF